MLSTYNWKKEHNRLWAELVPKGGQAETLQGELIRIAGKLSDQAYRNGNGNWDEWHEYMWRFVGEQICADEALMAEEKELISNMVERIINEKDCPDISGSGSPYYVISEKVVDYCMRNKTLIPHIPNPDMNR
jgi:hypothetical protein